MTPHAHPHAEPHTLPVTWAFGIMLVAAVWLWPGTFFELGLHGDEAYAGLQAYGLLHGGAWTLKGMNSHTGPAHQWLVAGVFALVGPSVPALRSVSALLGAAAVALYARALTPHLGRTQALWATALLVTLPSISTFGAVATEHNALSPILALVGWLLVQRAMHAGRPRWPAVLGGMTLGLGTWTHLIFLGMPASLVALGLRHHGRRLFDRTAARWAFFGWLMVELLPFIGFCERIKVRRGGLGILQRTAKMPLVLFDAWQGDMAALRTIGTVAGPGRWVALTLLGVAAAGLARTLLRRRFGHLIAGHLLTVLGAQLVVTAIIVPFLADRFVLLMLYVVPPLLVLGFFGWAEKSSHWGAARFLGHGLCTALLIYQVSFFMLQVVRPWQAGAATGNLMAPYGVDETSNHYLDSRPLYAALIERGCTDVVTQNFIGWALRFYDLKRKQLAVRLSDLETTFEPRAKIGPKDTLVTYLRGYKNFGDDPGQHGVEVLRLKDFVLLQATDVVPAP